MNSAGPAVVCRRLRFEHPSGRIGLVGLDLEVEPGEVVAVLGPNGSGKSTLLRLLATDLQPGGGLLQLLGRRVGARGSLRDLRCRIAYASDTPVHIPWLSGEEHARFMMELRGAASRDRWDAIHALLFELGLDEVRDVPISAYSFGMRRKLLLAETIGVGPDLLLLDEPTVGLDPPGEAALQAALERLARSGAAVVIASNETRSLPRWADRIVFLHRGELIEAAPPDVLLGRLKGHTRIDIDLAHDKSIPLAGVDFELIPGVRGWAWREGGIRVESNQGGAPLPSLLEALLSSGRAVRDVRVREPDLGDLFLALTGTPLSADPPDRGLADPATPPQPVRERR